MSDFGCFYNPRPAPGRCIKDPYSTTVEAKCEKVDNRCRLKQEVEPYIPDPFNPQGVILPGNKLVDYKILNYLPDEDLLALCELPNTDATKYCNSQDYWLNRIQYMFPYLSAETLEKYRGNRNWSDYYIDDLGPTNRLMPNRVLFEGVSQGRLDLVLIGLNIGANIPNDSSKLLCAAATHGDVEFLKELADMNVVSFDIENYLIPMCAAENGHIEMLKFLHRMDYDVGAVEVLRQAARSEQYTTVSYLFQDAGANANAYNLNALIRELYFAGKDMMISILVENGAPTPRTVMSETEYRTRKPQGRQVRIVGGPGGPGGAVWIRRE